MFGPDSLAKPPCPSHFYARRHLISFFDWGFGWNRIIISFTSKLTSILDFLSDLSTVRPFLERSPSWAEGRLVLSTGNYPFLPLLLSYYLDPWLLEALSQIKPPHPSTMLDPKNVASSLPWSLKDEFIGGKSSSNASDRKSWHRLEGLPTPFAAQYARLSQPWLPGFWTRFPYHGISTWLLALIGTMSAILILKYSDGVPVSDWDEHIQPTVCLALTSALSGAFLACAFTERAAISYWRTAGKPVTVGTGAVVEEHC